MSEPTTWGTLATSMATLEARVRREVETQATAVPGRDAVRRLYVRTVLAGDALRASPSALEAPAMTTLQRLVHRIVDSLDEDEAPWLALSAVRRIARGSRVVETHAANVAVLSMAMARALGLPRDARAGVGLAGLLHDIGMAGGTGTAERHDIDGAAWMLQWAPVDAAVKLAAVAAGHRSYDGDEPLRNGRGVADLTTRIVRIADAYDVLTGRDGAAGGPDLVLAFLLQGTGERFDTALLKLFARVVGIYPPGTAVRLGDGAIAVVARPNRRHDALDRPAVRVVIGANGTRVTSETIVDLAACGRDVVATVDPAAYGIDPGALALDR